MPFNSCRIMEDMSVVVQRSSHFKAYRVKAGRAYTFGKRGGKFTLNLDGAIGHYFGSSFRMEKVSNQIFNIKVIEEDGDSHDIVTAGGVDNRDLCDDGCSQKLTPEEINQLKSSGLSGMKVVQTITENSATFKDKTIYSQEKYVNKKQKKYEEVITIHKPSLRLLSRMYYLQDPLKISNLRMDSLSQLLCHANIQTGGRFAVYESSTAGLVTAAVLHRMGSEGHLVHVYQGNNPQREAVDLMNFTTAELEVLSFINFTKLPDKEQSHSMENGSGLHQSKDEADVTSSECIIKPQQSHEEDVPDIKMDSCEVNTRKLDDMDTKDTENEKEDTREIEKKDTRDDEDSGTQDSEKKETTPVYKPRIFVRKQIEDVQVSSSVLRGGIEGLVIACRQHPVNITLQLLHFLKPGHPFVVFSPYKEPLMELFFEVKMHHCTNIHLTETWLRHYQVLPMRTHPEVNMSGGGGYLLSGNRLSQVN